MLAALSASAAPVTIHFIHFSDLHAHLTPHLDKVNINGVAEVHTRGGLARVAQAIKDMRALYPNTIAMNIGDAYHGGVEAFFTNGNAIIDPVNAVGFDVGVPGNWDYAFGGDVTRLRYATLTALQTRLLQMRVGAIKRPNFPQLAANVSYAPGCPMSGQVMPATLTKTVAGIKVGMIGLSSDIVPMMGANLANCLVFTQGETNYKNLVEAQASSLRSEGAQIVVVMSELGIHKNSRLAQVLGKGLVDVIFSAHTHEATPVPLQSDSGTLVVESGNDGNIGRMAITIDGGVVLAREWTLTPITPSQAEDPVVAGLVATARAPFLAPAPNMTWSAPMGVTQTLNQPINTVVGYVNAPLDRRGALSSSFNNSFSQWLRSKAATDMAITPGFRFDAIVPAPGAWLEDNSVTNGAVTLEDVYRFFPLAYGISTGSVSGQRLSEILSENLNAVFAREEFSQGGGWTDGFAGLNTVVDLSGQSPKIVSLSDARGAAISAASIYSVTGCVRPFDPTDVLCGYTGFSNVAPLINSATSAPWTVVDIATDMFAANFIGAASPSALTLQNAPPLWPESLFVQPLSVNVTGQVSIVRSSLIYDRKTQTYRTTLQVKNNGASTLKRPLHLELSGFASGVSLVNFAGSHDGVPYLRIDADLAAGASANATAVFSNPTNQSLTYTVKTYSGGV